jgi:hypothetical protein
MKISLPDHGMKILLTGIFLYLSSTASAQLSAAIHYAADASLGKDTLTYNDAGFGPSALTIAMLAEDDTHLQSNLALQLSRPDERKVLMGYLQQLELDNGLRSNQSNSKKLYRLARLFARLKFYPLAMKCFLKSMRNDKNNSTLSLDNTQTDSIGSIFMNIKDDSLVNAQAVILKTKKSKATNYKRISSTFNDRKTAVAYALLFHVQQPVPGKRKIFVFSNTGHTFITLIKYNADSTYVSCSFGFYPKKDQIFSATPAYPSTSAQFKNDAAHQWDEVVGKFISKRRFDRILKLTKRYDELEYHLSSNNCTDFSLQAAAMAGINISDTRGKWPLGSGNNPAYTGQSIINGTFTNADAAQAYGLFSNINTTVK